ncbi:hypothetical protein BDV24DRAFT_175507 [Aspergillus arachidicola]|uniref:3-beta hydroxysteroid dehydrogenase/isomerase domain-containing protein n=1 Tax=Aspergillus arachidicola TaxID=656916 RepID=A0A2G7GAE2_9EURO|nr:hypothetical protein BDV24DRAFT_175507 [Aspergillus arachidicola]PIG89818.1 hypothetical protein AARAC_005870 [Aspergillus arachidicola]
MSQHCEPARSTPNLGPVLVTGGNGFIASHIIDKILEGDPSCEIHSLDINTSRNCHPNAHYHQGDISCLADVQRIMRTAKPVTVFHTAAPEFFDLPESAYQSIIVDGTNNLINAAVDIETVHCLVYTSTSSLIHDNLTDLFDAMEDMPVLRPPQQKRVYSLRKADAEEVVLTANRNKGFLTCSLRPCFTIGERCIDGLGRMVASAQGGWARYRLGNGKNLYDFVYVGNVADAHVLAAQHLVNAWGKAPTSNPDSRVDGEVFHITNGSPWLFWDFQREVAAQTGNPVRQEEIIVVPKWLVVTIGFLTEYIVWAVSLGSRSPTMTRDGIRFGTITRTISGDKAMRVLGYQPRVSVQEGIERGVKWILEHQKIVR